MNETRTIDPLDVIRCGPAAPAAPTWAQRRRWSFTGPPLRVVNPPLTQVSYLHMPTGIQVSASWDSLTTRGATSPGRTLEDVLWEELETKVAEWTKRHGGYCSEVGGLDE